MNFLIVSPQFTPRKDDYYELPIGIMYVSASLKQAGYNVYCFNLQNYSECFQSVLKEYILKKRIDVLCIGGITAHYRQIKEVLVLAKEIKPDIITIVGGGLISSEPELMLDVLKFDFGVIGEGEKTIVELAEAITQKIESKRYRDIDGIIYREDGNIVITSPRKAIENIDDIPWPDREGFGIDEYLGLQRPSDIYLRSIVDNPRALSITASRSCPFNCTFCYHPLGKKYRQRSLDAIFKEIDYLLNRYKINILSIVDELLANDVDRLQEFCKRIKPYNLFWTAQLRVDKVDENALQMMKQSGCFCISYGLESANNHVLKSLKKHITVEQINMALELTNKAGICVQGNMIIGDVEDTWETAMQSLQWAIDHKPFNINVGPIILYPGSKLYAEALLRGKIKNKLQYIEAGCPLVNVTKMTEEEYFKFFEKVSTDYQSKMIIPAILQLEKKGNDYYNRELYAIELRCPFCGNINIYNNMSTPTPTGNSTFFCKHCFYRYKLPFYFGNDVTFEVIQYINLIIDKLGADAKIALWGASNNTRKIICYTKLLHSSLVCIFDNDIQKHGLNLDGVKIINLPKDPAEVKKIVDIIIISSKNHEINIYSQISYLKQFGIKISGLYNESTKLGCD